MTSVEPHLKAILEAILLVADRPLGARELARILPEFPPAAVRTTLKIIQTEYDNEKRGFELREVAEGYRLQTRGHLKEWIARLGKTSPPRMSRPALETLAIVAYKQPVTRAAVEELRGVDTSGTLKFLLEKKLVKIVGRKDVPGRPLLYGTARRFLEVFDLKDLDALPRIAEMTDSEEGSDGQPALPLFQKFQDA